MWLYHWALMVSCLMAVDHVGRHAGGWIYITGSTPNHENIVKTNTHGWMLYSVYAKLGVYCSQCILYLVDSVLGVNSWSWHGAIERDDLRWCSAIMVELWMRRRVMGNEDQHNVEDTNEYGKSGVPLAWLDWKDLVSVQLHSGLGLVPALSGMVNWLAHEILLIPVSQDDLPHLFWSLSFLSSTLLSPKNTKLCHSLLSLHAIVGLTLSTAYTEYNIPWVLHTPLTASFQDQ